MITREICNMWRKMSWGPLCLQGQRFVRQERNKGVSTTEQVFESHDDA
jgi:hypothetical protein